MSARAPGHARCAFLGGTLVEDVLITEPMHFIREARE